MSPAAIHQFVPALAPRDAIGGHVLQLQGLLREMGFQSDIFAGSAHPELAQRARPYRRFGWRFDRRQSWLLYQCSIGSPMADFFAARSEPTMINYHNITPGGLLRAWDPEIGRNADLGRHQMTKLAPKTTLAIADSRFNESELGDAGFGRTVVATPLIDLDSRIREPDEATADRLAAGRRGGGADLLFVGRIAPNKGQHDVIKALAAYRRAYDAKARLHLVGGVASSAYNRSLNCFVEELGLRQAVDFAGSVTDSQLAAYYRSADVFVCCSDHEGFCVPLLEAMQHRLPIIAYGAAAIPETVEGAGLVLPDKTPALVAAAVRRVVEDGALRQALGEAGVVRLEELSLDRSRARFATVIEEAVSENAS